MNKKECRYCNLENGIPNNLHTFPIIETRYRILIVRIDGENSKLFIGVRKGNSNKIYKQASLPIEYCPVCGRNLKCWNQI